MAKCPFIPENECRESICALWNAAESKCYLASYCGGIKSVQRGENSVGDTPVDVTITSVDLSKAFVVCSARSSSEHHESGTARLINATTLRLTRGYGTSVTICWEVVEFQ